MLIAIRDAYAAGNMAGAVEAQTRMHVLDKLLGAHGGKAASRAIFKHALGIDLGAPRAPLVQLTDAQGEALMQALKAAGFHFSWK